MTIKVSTLTSLKLKNGEYKAEFPEFYQLQEVIENGAWHAHQDVLDHVIKVYEALKIELSSTNVQTSEYLQQKIGNRTREEILKIATLLHDIGKKETLIVSAQGQTSCPGHEHIAAGKVKHFAQLFELDEVSQRYVERIVIHHGFISDILLQVISKPEKEQEFLKLFQDTVGDVSLEILLFMKADLHGCDILSTVQKEHDEAKKILTNWLN